MPLVPVAVAAIRGDVLAGEQHSRMPSVAENQMKTALQASFEYQTPLMTADSQLEELEMVPKNVGWPGEMLLTMEIQLAMLQTTPVEPQTGIRLMCVVCFQPFAVDEHRCDQIDSGS